MVFHIVYDNNSNITQLVNEWRDTTSTWHSDTELYSYDGLDRLTSASCTSWSHNYSYDKAGNRTTKDGVTYTINTVNEVTGLSDGTSFTYDSNGNRTGKTKGTDTWAYTYNYANKLTKVEKNSLTLGEYVYDGNGKRIQVTENSATTTYIYLGLNVLYEENDTGTATYIYGPTGRLAKRTIINGEPNTFYYHADRLGSTRLVTDESKNVVTAVTYHPFGDFYSEEGWENYLFTGKKIDSTGFYYYGARYYDPDLGRFITRDSLWGTPANPQALNRYTYCTNNPLRYIDPDGCDYYDPEWGQGRDGTWSILWAMLWYKLWKFEMYCKMLTAIHNFAEKHEFSYRVIQAGGLSAITYAIGKAVVAGSITGPQGAVLGFVISIAVIIIDTVAEKLAVYWNDSEFVELWEIAQDYVVQLMNDEDCTQEAMDAWCELAVYILQIQFGDNWREYAPQILLDYYDEMREREESEGDVPDDS